MSGRSGDEDVARARIDKHMHRQSVDERLARILPALVSFQQRLSVAGRFTLRRLRRADLGRQAGRGLGGWSGRGDDRRRRGQSLQQRERTQQRRRDAKDHGKNHAPEHCASASYAILSRRRLPSIGRETRKSGESIRAISKHSPAVRSAKERQSLGARQGGATMVAWVGPMKRMSRTWPAIAEPSRAEEMQRRTVAYRRLHEIGKRGAVGPAPPDAEARPGSPSRSPRSKNRPRLSASCFQDWG